MKMLTNQNRKDLPELMSQDGKAYEAIAYLKYFSPYSAYTFYVTEGSPRLDENGKEYDFEFYGLVIGLTSDELGSTCLSQIVGASRGVLPLVERDMHFTPKPLSQCANVVVPMWAQKK